MAESPEGEIKEKDETEAVPTRTAVKMVDEIKTPLKTLPLKDRNWSWPVFILVLAYILTMALLAINYSTLSETGDRIGFLFGTFIVGMVAGLVFYNLGKWVFAKFAGYHLVYFVFTGLVWDKGRQKHWQLDSAQFLEFHSRFAPDNDNLDADPRLMLWGGLIAGLLLMAVGLVLGFVLTFPSVALKWAVVFGAAFSGTYLLYEILPVRQDYPSDAYALSTVRDVDNRRAFNILYVNLANMYADRDFAVPFFKDYGSYWKARTLIYVYLDQLYRADVEAAVKTLSLIQTVAGYLNDSEKGLVAGERMFILLLLKDRSGADSLFIALPKILKTEIVKPRSLPGYRSALLVASLILNREDTAIAATKGFAAALPAGAQSTKIKQEKKYFAIALDKAREANPNFALPQD